jgi:hypothetical protein
VSINSCSRYQPWQRTYSRNKNNNSQFFILNRQLDINIIILHTISTHAKYNLTSPTNKFNYNLTHNPTHKSKLSNTYMHNLKNVITVLSNYTPHHCLAIYQANL